MSTVFFWFSPGRTAGCCRIYNLILRFKVSTIISFSGWFCLLFCREKLLPELCRTEFSELKIPYLRPATPQSIQSHTNRPDHHRHTHHPARQLSQKLTRRPVNQLIAAVTDSQKNHQPHQNTQHKADCCQAPIRNILFQSLSPSLIFLLLSHAPHSIIRHIAFLLFLLLHKKVLVHMKTRTFALLNCICVF